MYRRFGKRLFDLTITIPALVLLSPIIAVVALLVRSKLGSPILFRQQRPGLHGRPFMMYKFRTMTDERDNQGNLLPDSQRLTPFGRFLRSTSLDELPELINVLRGEMSLVGPRPLLMRYMPYYTQEEQKRFSLLPGITGWAQINGRNGANWDMRMHADIEYVQRISLSFDLQIIIQTLLRVIKRDGVHVDTSATMLDFDEERRHKQATHSEHIQHAS